MSHKNMIHAQETINGEILVDNFAGGGGMNGKTNLTAYLLGLDPETVWMHFYAGGCEACPAREYCEKQPEGTCCRENFMGWAEEVRS